MKRLAVVGLAAVAGLATSAAPASAAAAQRTVVLKTAKGALAVGAPLTLSNTHLPFNGPWGEFICTSSATGALGQNGSATDTAELTSATFGDLGEEPCYIVEGKFSTAIVRALDLPWRFELATDNLGAVKGTPAVAFEVELISSNGDGAVTSRKCVYEKRGLKTITGFGKPMEIELTRTSVRFLLNKARSGEGCLKQMFWGSEPDEAGNWEVSSNGEPVEADLS
ncbi:MAG TPA: hypothetical protein VMF09_13005 [Solirubrobacteraceae bacterium]|nr:hypothetical protein [Solirubrobacteraceae bacterium]